MLNITKPWHNKFWNSIKGKKYKGYFGNTLLWHNPTFLPSFIKIEDARYGERVKLIKRCQSYPNQKLVFLFYIFYTDCNSFWQRHLIFHLVLIKISLQWLSPFCWVWILTVSFFMTAILSKVLTLSLKT